MPRTMQHGEHMKVESYLSMLGQILDHQNLDENEFWQILTDYRDKLTERSDVVDGLVRSERQMIEQTTDGVHTKKIIVIKMVRERKNCGLGEAVELVRNYFNKRQWQW